MTSAPSSPVLPAVLPAPKASAPATPTHSTPSAAPGAPKFPTQSQPPPQTRGTGGSAAEILALASEDVRTLPQAKEVLAKIATAASALNSQSVSPTRLAAPAASTHSTPSAAPGAPKSDAAIYAQFELLLGETRAAYLRQNYTAIQREHARREKVAQAQAEKLAAQYAAMPAGPERLAFFSQHEATLRRAVRVRRT